LYSALTTLNDGKILGYYLDNKNNWDVNVKELERCYQNAVKHNVKPRAILLINPGNPTG